MTTVVLATATFAQSLRQSGSQQVYVVLSRIHKYSSMLWSLIFCLVFDIRGGFGSTS